MTQCLQRERTQSGDVNGSASIVVHLQRFLVMESQGQARRRWRKRCWACAGQDLKPLAVSSGKVDVQFPHRYQGHAMAWSLRPLVLLQGYPILWGAGDRQDIVGTSAGRSMCKAVLKASGVLLAQGSGLPGQIQRGGRAHPAPSL